MFSGISASIANVVNKLRNAFSPASLANMFLWLKNSAGIISDGAVKFVSTNKDYLYTLFDSTWATTGSFELGGFVTPRSIGTYQILAAQYNPSNLSTKPWALRIRPTGVLEFITYNTGLTEPKTATFDTPLVLGTKYFILASYVSTSKMMRLKVNAVLGTDAIRTTAIGTASYNITLGVQANLSTYWSDFEMDSFFFSKNVNVLASATIYNALYNSGNGRSYKDLTAANGLDTFKTGLSHWYDFNEPSGIRYDKKGTSHLIAGVGAGGVGTGPVGVAGIASGEISNGDTVSRWSDLVTGISFSQPSYAKRGIYSTTAVNGNPGILFDGILDSNIASVPDFIGTGDVTFFIAIEPRGFGANNQGRIIDNSKFIIRYSAASRIVVISDGSTYAISDISSIIIGTAYIIGITRTSSGVTNIYVDGVLNGTADQFSGTPVAGNSVYLGNSAAGIHTFNGGIGEVIEYAPRILPQSEITTVTDYLKGKYGIA